MVELSCLSMLIGHQVKNITIKNVKYTVDGEYIESVKIEYFDTEDKRDAEWPARETTIRREKLLWFMDNLGIQTPVENTEK